MLDVVVLSCSSTAVLTANGNFLDGPLLHSASDTISQCFAVLQLCHCYIQWPTQYHSVLPSFSCATVTFSDQHNFTVLPSPLPLQRVHFPILSHAFPLMPHSMYEVYPENSRIYRIKIFQSYLEAIRSCCLQSTPLYSVCTAASVSSMFWSIPGKLF